MNEKSKEQLLIELEELRKQNKKCADELKAFKLQQQASEQQLKVSNLELKTRTKELIKSKEEIDTFFRTSNDLMVIADLNKGKFIKINPAWSKLLGYSERTLISKPFVSFIHPEDIEKTEEAVKVQLDKGKKILHFQNRYRAKDGSYKWFDWMATPNMETGLTYSTARDITKQKKTEEQLQSAYQQLQANEQQLRAANQQLMASEQALRESEEKFKTLFKRSNLPLCYVDKEGNISLRNDKFIKTFGYTEEDVPSLKEWWINAYPDEKYRDWVVQNWEHAVSKAAETGDDIESDEYNVSCKDGSVRNIIISGTTIENNFMATFIDITERKQAEEEYHTIIRTALDGFWLLDKNGNILDVNDAYCQLSGYSREELLSMHISDLEKKESGEETKKHIQKVIEIGYDRFESFHKCKNGTIITVKINATYNAFGSNRFYVFIHDITESKQTEQQLKAYNQQLQANEQQLKAANQQLMASEQTLRESEERYTLVIDASEQGIWDWNVETNQVYYSPQWKKQIGYEDHELDNDFATWIEHMHPDERENCQKAVQDYLSKPVEHFILEFRFRHKDGSYHWIYNKAASIRNSDGQIVRMFGAHTDITEKKTADEMLKNRNQELETFHSMAVGREKRMIELKKKINELNRELGKGDAFDLSFIETEKE